MQNTVCSFHKKKLLILSTSRVASRDNFSHLSILSLSLSGLKIQYAWKMFSKLKMLIDTKNHSHDPVYLFALSQNYHRQRRPYRLLPDPCLSFSCCQSSPAFPWRLGGGPNRRRHSSRRGWWGWACCVVIRWKGCLAPKKDAK